MRIVGVNEAARIANLGRQTLLRLVAENDGPPVVQLSPRRVGFIEEDLEKWLRGRRRSAAISVAAVEARRESRRRAKAARKTGQTVAAE
jgi:predicted DNA-binding transcriptional regulator AlpA